MLKGTGLSKVLQLVILLVALPIIAGLTVLSAGASTAIAGIFTIVLGFSGLIGMVLAFSIIQDWLR